jgi:Signal transduction histidine kinase
MRERSSHHFVLLYPPMLEEMGLKSAIPWYLDGFSQRSGIKVNFNAASDFGRLSRDAELVLFRVLQESLTNVQRHSGSKTVDISISQSKDTATMHVTDQGKGMPSSVIEQGSQDWMGSFGVGLRGMSERLRQVGGDLDISSDETGTKVRATVPLSGFQSVTTAASWNRRHPVTSYLQSISFRRADVFRRSSSQNQPLRQNQSRSSLSKPYVLFLYLRTFVPKN